MKKTFALIFISIALFGALLLLAFVFDVDLPRDIFKRSISYYLWGSKEDGGASNAPIFFGLMAVAGAMLLVSVKEKINTQAKHIHLKRYLSDLRTNKKCLKTIVTNKTQQT